MFQSLENLILDAFFCRRGSLESSAWEGKSPLTESGSAPLRFIRSAPLHPLRSAPLRFIRFIRFTSGTNLVTKLVMLQCAV